MTTCGYLGRSSESSTILHWWNEACKDHELPLTMVKYHCNEQDIAARLSDMWHHDRALYIVSPALQSQVVPFLDVCPTTRATVIFNTGGVLFGEALELSKKTIEQLVIRVAFPDKNPYATRI